MMKFKIYLPFAGLFLAGTLVLGFVSGCRHLPTMPDEPFVPVDTTVNPIDTMVVDTTTMLDPCDPDIVYFERDVLPILISNCTTAGCHNATDRADGVVLTDYDRVIQTADVRPFDLQGSDLYEVITDTDPEDRMPQAPRAALSAANINLISTWILQGAENKVCQTAATCDTSAVSYSQTIVPILETSCRGCHSGGTPSGGINLAGYAGVRTVALDGRLYGTVARLAGFSPMPQGGPALPDCQVNQIKSWVEAGAPEN